MSSKTVLKRNKKLDRLYHSDTGLVFKSSTEKVVIGRIVDDDFVPLDDKALELCEQNNFKYDESLVEMEEEQETEVKETGVKETGVKETTTDTFTAILTRYTQELQNYVTVCQAETKEEKERLESQLATTTKDLEEIKKKLKAVLSVMQENL